MLKLILNTNNRKKLRWGEIFVKNSLISKKQLDESLEYQKEKKQEQSEKLHIGEVIVKLGFAEEQELINVINKYFDTSMTSLSDNIEQFVRIKTMRPKIAVSFFRFPIWVKLSVTILVIVALVIFCVGYAVLEREKIRLYEQTVKVGKVSLAYFVGSAKLPLINDDVLNLNLLIKEVVSVDDVLYAFIINNKNIIKAHTDYNLIGKDVTTLQWKEENNTDKLNYFQYETADGTQILNISSPVLFQDIKYGEVNVGISLNFIDEQINKEYWFLIQLSLVMVMFGLAGAVMLSIGFSKPIKKLVKATHEIGRGNYDHEVRLKSSDEFNTLGNAFNYMAYELKMKSMMQDTFGRYISPEILDLILANPEQAWLKGVRSEASILFTDIRGFTAYSEDKEPEQVVEALNQYFEIATQAILDHGGYVDKFIGDAVLGVFGVPVARGDHAERAVKAAWLMQERLKQAAEKQNNELLAAIGIGINSGVVVSGNLGSDVKMEYSVIGDSVNLASRINSFAGSGEIIISQAVLDVFKCKTETLDPRKVKGKSELIQAYRVLELK